MKTLFIPLIFIFNSAFAQIPVIEWQYCYGGSGFDDGKKIILDSDGSIFLFGVTASPNDGDVNGYHPGNCWFGNCFDYWIVKTDSVGYIIWQQPLGGSNDEYTISGLEIDSGKIILNGTTSSNNGDVNGNHGSADAWMVRLDSSGNLESQKCYGGSGWDEAHLSSYRLSNNGRIFCGSTDSSSGNVSGSHGSQDIWLFKTDSTDSLIWQKCIGGSLSDNAFAFKQTSDKGYLLVGNVESVDGDITTVSHGGILGYDYWLCKIDSSGNILWQKDYGGTGDDEARACVHTRDGGFLVAGRTTSNDFDISGGNHSLPGRTDIWIIKIDSAGALIWQRCYGGKGSEKAWDMDSTADGGFIVCGSTTSHDGDVTSYVDTISESVWIMKCDSLGNIEWNKSVGGSGTEMAESISATSDGGCIFTGYTTSYDGDVAGQHGAGDIWVVKLSSPYVGIVEPIKEITDFSVFQNPVSNTIEMSFYFSSKENVNLQLIDITGRILLQDAFSATNGLNKHQIFTGDLGGGIYFVRLQADGGAVTKKVVIQ